MHSSLSILLALPALLLPGAVAEAVAASTSCASSTGPGSTTAPLPPLPTISGNCPPKCKTNATTQNLASPPYINYFLSTCNVAGQVVVTSPLPSSNLNIIGPRLIAAFPGGNSGIAAFFAPTNGKNGSLSLELVPGPDGDLTEVYKVATGGSEYPSVGLAGVLSFNDSATLTVALLGSVRTIRDFVEGPSILVPEIQDAIKVNAQGDTAVLSRKWLDEVTTSELGFAPVDSSSVVKVDNGKVTFTEGRYLFWTDYNYPQLTQLDASAVLSPESRGLITQEPDTTTSLAFLSYSEKLLAGAWRFLTYFGRDSMISALLLEPVLSEGQGGAIEAVIGAVLERINRTDGSVCHEETLGDYATFLNAKNNVSSSDDSYTYPMVDTDFYLPVLMERYFKGASDSRVQAIFDTKAGALNKANSGLTWGDLAHINAEKIMGLAGQFASQGKQTIDNLVHLKSSEIVGNWRDSTYGIGGGRIPYDVNTALMPAALRSVASLTRSGVYTKHPEWKQLADTYAQVWEDETLQFFEVKIAASEAQNRLQTYVKRAAFSGPDQSSLIEDDVIFNSVSLQGNDNLAQVQVMNSDDCFRLFLFANSTSSQSQLTSFLNQSALNVMRPFPAGLLTSVGMLVANPAYGEQPVYATNFSTNAYHGTVVWSWQQAMMAKGFELQLARCSGSQALVPDFCKDAAVRGNVLKAYNALWDTIEANSAHLSGEVWSWTYDNGFQFAELGSLPPPPGVGVTESDIRQLWSLTFLAVTRNTNFKNL